MTNDKDLRAKDEEKDLYIDLQVLSRTGTLLEVDSTGSLSHCSHWEPIAQLLASFGIQRSQSDNNTANDLC